MFNIRNAMGNNFDSLNEVQGDASSWPVPSLAKVGGTTLTRRAFSYFDAVLSGSRIGHYVLPAAFVTVLRRELHKNAQGAPGDIGLARQG